VPVSDVLVWNAVYFFDVYLTVLVDTHADENADPCKNGAKENKKCL